uniref:hypothetical protein n=1 Tax=Parerythrobacter lutipelagi TaxID=1964208 RepID=UPI0010F6EA7F|nr:hypothetical protein [Parerythrobacter lutipelagi]
MSKVSLGLLSITIGLIVLATLLELPFAANGSGLLFVAGLVYAYWVARRELQLLTYIKNTPDNGEAKPRRAASVVPQGYSPE